MDGTCPVIRSSRNLPKSQLGAVIFGCKHHTFSECLNRKIFGLPDAHYSYVKNINPGLVLFLFNYSDRNLHGIFKAVSRGQLNLDNQAWASCEGVDYSPYAAQVQMDFQTKCRPLFEDEFKPIIGMNYYSEKLYWYP
ncbi:hypothetical protein CASFOL_024340 [Castilleja foliolosa]|uniref:DCD domain-containing protein n=1 Tax=Castilleja foliolosa TaxID=1961234 RepID=A0ABD3CN16_9LAMI